MLFRSESWWNVAVAEVSEMESVREARKNYETARARTRFHLGVNTQEKQ